MQEKKGRKKKASATTLDEAIMLQEEEMLEKEIKRSLKNKLDEELDDIGASEEEIHIHTLFDAISSNEGHYAKIYRIDPVPEEAHGHPLFLYDIRRPEGVKDLERELQTLAIRYGWCDGLYEIRVLKAGVSKPLRVAEIALAVPHEVEKNPFQVSPTGLHTLLKDEKPLEGVAEMMKAMKELTPEVKEDKTTELLQGLLTNMVEAQKEKEALKESSQTELLKALVEASKPKPQPQMDLAGILTALSPILVSLITPRETRSDLASLIEAKQAGVIPEPKREGANALHIIKELRESGLIASPTPANNPMSSLTQVTELLGTMMPIMEKMGGGGGNSSVGVELVRALIPQLGKIVGDVTGTINNAITAKTTILTRGKKAAASTPRIEQAQPAQPQASPEILAIANAISTRDTTFFPTLKDNILGSFGDQGYESLINGEVPVSSVLDQLKPFHEVFSRAEALEYFNGFLLWAKEKKSTEFTAKCPKCSDEYIFDSREEFEGTKHTCEICNTVLGDGEKVDTVPDGGDDSADDITSLEDASTMGGSHEELPSD